MSKKQIEPKPLIIIVEEKDYDYLVEVYHCPTCLQEVKKSIIECPYCNQPILKGEK